MIPALSTELLSGSSHGATLDIDVFGSVYVKDSNGASFVEDLSPPAFEQSYGADDSMRHAIEESKKLRVEQLRGVFFIETRDEVG